MAATYDLTQDFDTGDELGQQAPYWVVGICRFKHQVTYDLATRKSVPTDDNLGTTADAFTMAEKPPLVLTGSVTDIQVSAAKESHVSNLSLTITPGDLNMVSEIMPGDWVVACMLNSETQGRVVAQKMRQGKAVNGWTDGFKFLGKVSSSRKSMRSTAGGTLSTSYRVQCVGSGEFDSLLFYNPQLDQQNSIPVELARFGVLINAIVLGDDPSVVGGAVDINKVIPRLVQTIFGQGAWAASQTAVQDTTGATALGSPNSSYLIPQTVANWLDMPDARTYNDVLYTLLGVQHYRTVVGVNAVGQNDAWSLFQPDGVQAAEDLVNLRTLKTPSPLIGWFPLSAPPMQATVWDMLSGYMNAPLNEMFVALKVDPDGRVFPHLIARQTPYTSVSQAGLDSTIAAVGPVQGVDVTDFLELPRWKLPSAPGRNIVLDADIGRSDAIRFNMVHISGTGSGSPDDSTQSFARALPVTDNIDIKRHGVRPYLTGLNCVLKDQTRGPAVWRDIMADVVMGQHLRLNGQIVCIGIQAPIAPGDNLEFDGIVFHIESVAHVGGINTEGGRVFTTILQVTHGVDNEEKQQVSVTLGQSQREAEFPGVADGDDILPDNDHVVYERLD